jgi:hypothetical protein
MNRSEGADPAIKILRKRTETNDLEYRFVMESLAKWANPRAKLTRLLEAGALIRVTKGLYIFAPLFRKTPLSLPMIANKIYGPSYVSLEWALAYYGLIPEGVVEVTSVTIKSSKIYKTPLGCFSYAHLHPKAYSLGITLVQQGNQGMALLATAEKALTDELVLRRGKVQSQKVIKEILLEDLRIEEKDLTKLKVDQIRAIYDAHPHSAIQHLITFLERLSS